MTAVLQNIEVQVIKRDGSRTPFDSEKITNAIRKAYKSQNKEMPASQGTREFIAKITEQVQNTLMSRRIENAPIFIEDIQDQVELALMRSGDHAVARAYVLYREERKQARVIEHETESQGLTMVSETGQTIVLERAELLVKVERACQNLPETNPVLVVDGALTNLFKGARQEDLDRALLMSARALIEKEPAYSQVTARLLLQQLGLEVGQTLQSEFADAFSYQRDFESVIRYGVKKGLIHEDLLSFDLQKLSEAMDSDRDLKFDYLGLQTLYDRYLLHSEGNRFEMPQTFFMRVAMGLALNEVNREEWALVFYNQLSSFNFMCSTPTLFNSGTPRPQLSSCFLTTIQDDLGDIYDGMRQNALLSKYAGGIGNDWTPVRGLGAHIKGTNGTSLGVVPFMKVANDTAVAVNQGGKRKGAVCAYLEAWHIDVEEFTELRKNTGDDRRRTHDMNTAVWVPDLFMKRLEADEEWTLFSPDEVNDLHDLWGQAFETRYSQYEKAASEGRIRVFKRLSAKLLWRKLLSMLFETGHPWITFKDACNARSPQSHVGTVHSSNLCTEITLNTSEQEVAVCNLGSVNLRAHLKDGVLDKDKLKATIHVAMRMLDNVIDINYYTIPQARNANRRHRPVGLGLMGFQDALHDMGLAYGSHAAVEFADESMEAISYFAIEASTELAIERGSYSSFKGSLWHQGVLPLDSLSRLAEARGEDLDVDTSSRMDWDSLRQKAKHGMRNSNCLAIAPTATISNICGVSQSIEPSFRNLFVKSNMSGEFTVVNRHLISELKHLGLWDEVMVEDLKYYDGIISSIQRIPEDLKKRFATAFEIESHWLISAASRRQKWLDQSQSLNLYQEQPSGKALDRMYRLAWKSGLKTTYYLRTQAATHAEKSTITSDTLNAVCRIDDPDCEACQ